MIYPCFALQCCILDIVRHLDCVKLEAGEVVYCSYPRELSLWDYLLGKSNAAAGDYFLPDPEHS